MSDIIGLHGEQRYIEASKRFHTGSTTKGIRFVKTLILILSIGLIAEAAFYFIISPFTSTIKLSFTGTHTMSEAELKKAAGLTGLEKWGRINTAVVSRRLASYPLIAEAKVTKRFPDKLLIEISERKSVGMLLATVGGRTVPMGIDKTGTVFRTASTESPRTVPVISGLIFQNIHTGMKVHKQLVSLFKQLDILQKKAPSLLTEISEITIEQKKYGGFDLILYPVQMQIRVRSDSLLNEGRLQYMMLVLDVVRKLDLSSKIEELDIRGGTASFRLRGETDE